MLTFFVVADDIGDPLELLRRMPVEELQLREAGKIDVRPFHELETYWDQLRSLGIAANYFDDFRITGGQVQEALLLLERFTPPSTLSGVAAQNKICEILWLASDKNAGLFAICG